MLSFAVNWIAIIIATVVTFIIGFAWYSPMLFGNDWIKEMKMDAKKSAQLMKDNAAKGSVIALVSAFISAIVLSVIIYTLGATGAAAGATVGALIWIGFLFTNKLAMSGFSGTSARLFLINTGHDLVALLVIGAIIGFMFA